MRIMEGEDGGMEGDEDDGVHRATWRKVEEKSSHDATAGELNSETSADRQNEGK